MTHRAETTPATSRRRAYGLVLGTVAVAGVGVGAALTAPRTPITTERIVGLGFEDVVDRAASLPQLAGRLDRVAATGVSISVGRVDWTAFPWPDHDEAWSAPVRATGRDYVAEALAAVGTDAGGEPRNVVAVVDVLVAGWIATDPSIAGVSSSGERSTEFASLTALTAGVVGERLVELVTAVGERYGPDTISLTELFLDTYTFGDDDLESYRSWSGAQDWPRTPAGEIDSADPGIGRWRAGAVTALVSRAGAAAHAHGVELQVEVRASWDGPHEDPGMDGQDYSALLGAADRLVVWGYFGLEGLPGSHLEEVARALPSATRGRFVMSVGLWASDGTISAGELGAGVRASESGGMSSVWVTPASLMTESHWEALRAAWAP